MVDAGLFTDRDMDYSGPTLKDNLERAVANLGNSVRKEGLASLSISVIDDVSELDTHCDTYAKEHNVKKELLFDGKFPDSPVWSEYDRDRTDRTNIARCKLGGLIVAHDYEAIVVESIGPALEALEQHPRVGQSVLAILEGGLMKCTRGLTPGFAIDWASFLYWGSEDDDEMRVSEEVDCIADETEREHQKENPGAAPLTVDQIMDRGGLDIFRTKHLRADVPDKWDRKRRPLKVLPDRFKKNHKLITPSGTLKDVFYAEKIHESWPQIRAACETIKELGKLDIKRDNHCCERISWEAVPFVLRMHDKDCIPRMIDDCFNQIFECDEVQLEINSVFLWHDAPSMARAARRLQNFLRLTKACEDLISLLK